MADERRLTVIVVPHGDLETRTYEISYGRLRFYLLMFIAVAIAVALVLALWFPIAAQAGRVPALVRENERLHAERAQVTELARTLAEVEAQYERVRQLLGADAPSGDGQPLLPPLRPKPDTAATETGDDAAMIDGVIQQWPLESRGFITRRVSDASDHPGVDIAVSRGSLIRAAGAGVVRIAGVDDVYGYYVVLDHGDGIQSLYGHADTLLVDAGARVAAGQPVARVGTSGRSSAPHLHFEVRRDGRPVDPLRFVAP
ncbi:MAG TPA: peptidoglycan DD-metalloendopeptidase family protein [Longimicrobiales bacterium]|nr:peptidoglycan DD-metalloendopeptidase family protein [Longimicrobiales bacterium]